MNCQSMVTPPHLSVKKEYVQKTSRYSWLVKYLFKKIVNKHKEHNIFYIIAYIINFLKILQYLILDYTNYLWIIFLTTKYPPTITATRAAILTPNIRGACDIKTVLINIYVVGIVCWYDSRSWTLLKYSSR